MNQAVEIIDYDPRWQDTFAALRDQIACVLGTLARSHRHAPQPRLRRRTAEEPC